MASIIGSGINGNICTDYKTVNIHQDMASIIGSGINGNLEEYKRRQEYAF